MMFSSSDGELHQNDDTDDEFASLPPQSPTLLNDGSQDNSSNEAQTTGQLENNNNNQLQLQLQQVVVGAVGAVNEALLINSFGKCDNCKKNNGTIGIQTSDCILPQRLCVTCARCKSKDLANVRDARFICYGCDASFDSFDKSRKKTKHGHCSLKQERTTSTKQQKRPSSSTTNDQQPSKKQSVEIIDFLLERDVFGIEETVIPFNAQHRSVDIFFDKTVLVHLTPAVRDPPYLILLQQLYPTVETRVVLANNIALKNHIDLLKMNIDLPPWPKPEDDDVAKVNIRVLFTNNMHTIDSTNGKSARSSRQAPSDITFKEGEPFTDKKKYSIATSSFDPRGFTPIEYSIATSDYNELERALQSNEYDLNARDNLGYTKEFWCHYFNNTKALKMIEEAKLRINSDREKTEDSGEISLTSLSSSLDKTSKMKPDAEAIVNNNKVTKLSRDNSGHVFSLTLCVISKNNLPAHWRGNLSGAIFNKLKEIEYKHPSIRVKKLNNSSFEISGNDIQECIKVKQLLVFRMVDVIYTKQPYHSNRYLLKVSSKEENLDFAPHKWKLFAGDKNFHTYRLKESSLPDVTQFEYPHPPKNLDKIKVLYTDGQDNISYSKDTITREIIMEELRNANVNRVMAKIYLGGTIVVKSKNNLKRKATTGPQLENGADAFQWHFDRDEIFNRTKMEQMLQSLKGSTLIHSSDPLNVYSVTLYDTQVTEDFTISLRMEDPDENGISRLVLLEEERYMTYDTSKNKAFSYSVDDTSRSSSMENGYIVKFWEGENRISRYETAELVAESLIFNHNLELFLFSDSNTDPLFQDASGRFWVKGGKKWTSESFFSVQHEDGREYKVELWNGDKPSVQLGPEDVYSTDYEQDYEHLMKFADHLIDQYYQY